MASFPRVVTVDPTGVIARIVRAALDLTASSVIQVDVPGAAEAFDEVTRAGCQLLVTGLHLNDASGIDLAREVSAGAPGTAVIVLGSSSDPETLDDPDAAYRYLRRPLDAAQFMRLFQLALDGGDILSGDAAAYASSRPAETDLGAIPSIDLRASERVVDSLLTDVGAMAIVLASRDGEILLERGAVGYLDREVLVGALLPLVRTTFDMGQLVGGQTSALHFYDGERYVVFVLSVGFHHFLSIVYDSQSGSRQFGAVNRFGRRAAEDLVTILGISAFAFELPQVVEAAPSGKPVAEPEADVLIARAEEWAAAEAEAEPAPEPEPLRLDPIENLDLSLFDNTALENLDFSAADDLFDPEKLAEIANENRSGRGPLTYEEARELGILP